jgi:hypothetical protein
MELYVNPQITGFRQDVDGTIKELKIGSNKEDAYENIIEQGGKAKLENNKTATINVSTYTEPVEVTPTAGKDGMKKATVTLSNIPSGIGNTLYNWSEAYQHGNNVYTFTPTPAVGDRIIYGVYTGYEIHWDSVLSVDGDTITCAYGDPENPIPFTRDSEGDVVYSD